MTTVGYGDIVPKTSVGRWAAVTIMLTGVAVIGVLAGSLASFFRLEPVDQKEDEASPTTDAGSPADDLSPAVTPTPEMIFRRMDELRTEMEHLMALLSTQPQAQAGDTD